MCCWLSFRGNLDFVQLSEFGLVQYKSWVLAHLHWVCPGFSRSQSGARPVVVGSHGVRDPDWQMASCYAPRNKLVRSRVSFGWAGRVLLFFALSCRVGEAVVPGPLASNFRLGLCNPSGLSTKASLFAMQEADAWMVSETHLTSVGLRAFRRELAALGSSFKWIVHGKPVGYRNEVSEVGRWAGVAIIGKCPTRPVPISWSSAQHASCRLVAAASFCRGLWITGVGVYGTPVGPTHPKAKASTEALLDEAVKRIQQSVGCRYVAGDWNHDHNSLRSVAVLKAMGFVDIQDLHFRAWGVNPVPTCRCSTRRDYMYVSPELAARLISCRVDLVSWSDHASLVAEFVGSELPEMRYLWPIPSKIEWDPQSNFEFVDFASPHCPDEQYRRLWKDREEAAVCSARSRGVQTLPSCLGRGACVKPVPCKSNPVPVRTARAGEIQPRFLGYSLLHVHWFKQLRRLQSYCRLAKVSCPNDNHHKHSHALWLSILEAPGFQPSFVDWWKEKSKTVGDELVVPCVPPSASVADQLFSSFQWDVKCLEDNLRRHKHYAARLKRVSDVTQLYKQVRRNAPDQVDALFRESVGVVSRVDHDMVALEFDEPVPWTLHDPVYHQGRRMEVGHVEPDKVWVESVADIVPGDSIIQPRHVGSLEALFHAFQEQWRSRWIRHANVSADRWEVVISFAQRYLQPVTVPDLDLSPSLIKAVVKSKRPNAATGLDGVSRHDMLSLDGVGLSSLCSLYQRAMDTGQWPTQVLKGAVKSLAKRELPSSPDHFRPVTVFSLVYRTWSSALSRYWLASISETLDPMLLGNRSGKQAADVWRYLLDCIEDSHASSTVASGLILDLEKAFNTLPRTPTLMAARLLGLSMPVVTAWAGALSNMARHFHVRGSYSDALLSDCGFPEGCGLSCLAMVAVDQLFHLWIAKSQELAVAVTYVDNWEILLGDPNRVNDVFHRVLEFSSLMDITVDSKKTIAWSTSSVTRRALSRCGFRVALSVRELGAHVTFSSQLRNATTTARVANLLDFWQKLRVASGTFQQKLRLICTAAWPRALHGISSCYLGNKHWVSLRAACMRALRVDKPGSNSMLQLSLGRLGLDPLMFAIIQTFRDFRSYGSTDLHLDRLAQLHDGKLWLPPSAVTEVLLARVHALGWTWTVDQQVSDGLSCFSLVGCGWSELERRLYRSWTYVVARSVQHGDTLRDFTLVDLHATCSAVSKLDPHAQAVLRPVLNGSMFTQEHAYKWSRSGCLKCPLCDQDDSFYHRLWLCSATAELRRSVPVEVCDIIPVLPLPLTVHGWDLWVPTADPWLRYLDLLPDPVVSVAELSLDPVLDFFTDGSCWWPATEFRIASWSVVVAAPPCLDMSARSTWVLASGPLPRIAQTAHRAELYALVVLAESVRQRAGQVFRVWSDCLSVVESYQLLVQGKRRLPRHHSHYDLWSRLLAAVRDMGANRFLVGKVPAHQDIDDSCTDLEAWAFTGNHAADVAAGEANRQRGQEFWDLWKLHSQTVLNVRRVGRIVREHMVNLSEFWQSLDIIETRVPEQRETEVRHRKFVLHWGGPCEITVARGLFCRRFSSIQEKFLEWWRTGVDETAKVQWISFGQLLIDWQLTVKHPGIILVDKAWIDPGSHEGCTPEIYPFRKRSRWWRMVVQQFVRDHDIVVGTASVCRPASEMLRCFIGCISIPWSKARLEMVETWLRSQLRTPILATGQELDQLPIPSAVG